MFSEQVRHEKTRSRQESPIVLPPSPVVQPPQQNPSALPPDLLSTDPHLWRTFDPDAWRDNPVEVKHRKLLRSQRLGDQGKDLKPGPADRDRLNVGYDGRSDDRKYFAFLPQHRSLLSTKTCCGNFAFLSLVRLDRSPNFSNVSPGPTPWRRNRQWRSCYRCGARKSGWMMRWNYSVRVSLIVLSGRLLCADWRERMTTSCCCTCCNWCRR